MHGYAQTSLQLFNQLIELGYPKSDLSQVHRSYGVTMRLFSGWYRSSGKTFVSHLVGTASILAKIGQPAPVVAAGMLHAAYANGDFGDGINWVTPKRRRQLAKEVGEEVESYVEAYSGLSWSPKKIPQHLQRIPTMDARQRAVLLIRLANELEECLDAGILYCGAAKRQDYADHGKAQIVDCARMLGYPALAIEIDAAQRAAAEASIPNVLQPWATAGSFQIVPKSCRRSNRVKAIRLLRAIKGRMSNIFLHDVQ